MRLSPAMSRSLLSTAAIALLLVPTLRARAADAIPSKAALSQIRSVQLIFTPATLRFGNVAVGRRKLRTVTITNSGNSKITLLQLTTQGTEFTLSGIDLPLTLARGESFTFFGVFAPRSAGARNGSISLASQLSGLSDVSEVANPILRLQLSGMGTEGGQLIVDPATMNFGTVQIGSSATQPGTLTAAAAQVTISSAISSNPEFSLSGLSFPVTIPADGSQGFLVTFSPQASGMASGTLSFLDSSGNPLAVELLNGVGTVSQSHSVDLSWNASTSQNVIGYNVYRGTTSGGPYSKINSVLDASTVYTDTSVTDGTTYYYVTTAVNSSDEESADSNEAQAIIP